MRIYFGINTGSGALYLKRREIFKSLWTDILDNIKTCFHTFGVRRTIYVLDSENQPGSGKIQTGFGSGALGLTDRGGRLTLKVLKQKRRLLTLS